MSVPQLKTYVSEDQNFTIKITSANPSNGQIVATYEASYSPEGALDVSGDIGGYAWVSDASGKNGGTPFSIRFAAMVRPSGWPYCILDTWTGAYQDDNTLLMEGARSYVNDKGVVEVGSLGTSKFS